MVEQVEFRHFSRRGVGEKTQSGNFKLGLQARSSQFATRNSQFVGENDDGITWNKS